MRRLLLLTASVGLLLAPGAFAQRATASLDWQGRSVAVDCGAPRVGKYTLDNLELNKPWRLGAGPASILTTGAPLVAGELVVPPGSYRIQLLRPGAEAFELVVEGAGRGAGGTSLSGSGDSIHLPGKLATAKPPSKVLEVALAPTGEGADKELRAAEFGVTFGAPRVDVLFDVVGTISKKGGGATIDGFKFPAEWLEKRLKSSAKTPVAALTLASPPKDAPKSYNLFLGDDARLVAQDAPATDAFAQLPAHVATFDRRGTVEWSDGAPAADHFTLDEAKYEKGKELRLVARLGTRKATIVIPLAAPAKQQ